jgi:hypothetical protein
VNAWHQGFHRSHRRRLAFSRRKGKFVCHSLPQKCLSDYNSLCSISYMTTRIDRNVPIPLVGKGGEMNEIISKMQVGDSVFIDKFKELNVWRNRISGRGFKAISRKEGKGWRVWKGKPKEEES